MSVRTPAPILWLEETDSTMLEAKRRLDQAPLWIAAKRQWSGRGTRGRAWRDEGGNLASSYVFWPSLPPHRWPEYSFTTALALRDCLAEFLPGAQLSLKWPNDVLLSGRKVAGILLETQPAGRGRNALCIGIGANLASHPSAEALPNDAWPASDVAAVTGVRLLAENVVASLIEHMAAWCHIHENDGFGAIAEAWIGAAHGLGALINAETASGQWLGRFAGVNALGHVQIEVDGRIVTLASAELRWIERD